MSDQFLFVEKYAPSTVGECILPPQIKKAFLQYVKEGEFPNLLLAGPAGVGKTSVAKALTKELGVDLLFVNASLDRGIGDVRTTVQQFASTVSLMGDKKVVLLDEADNLTQDSQKALRALIEEFQNQCRFILTCNYSHNVIDAIHSRCSVFDFSVNTPKARAQLGGEFFKRVVKILKEADVEFNDKILAKFIIAKSPDWRGILNTVQGNITDGKLSDDLLSESADALVEFLKAKRWTDARDWLFNHSYLNPRQVERELFWALQPKLTNAGKVTCVEIFGEYSKNIGLGADPVITLLALATTVMLQVEFI